MGLHALNHCVKRNYDRQTFTPAPLQSNYEQLFMCQAVKLEPKLKRLEATRREKKKRKLETVTAETSEGIRKICVDLRPILASAKEDEEETKGKDSERKDSERKDSERKDSEGKDSERKDSERKDSEGKDSEGKDSERKNSEGKDSERKDSERKDSEAKDSERKDSERKDSERKDSERKDSERKDSEGKDSERKDSEGKDSERKDSERKDSERKDSEGKDSERKDSEGKDSEGKDSEAKDSERKDSERKDSERKDSEGKDSERKNSERKDSEAKDSERKDSERKDSERKDSERKDSERKDSERKDSEGKGSKGKDKKENGSSSAGCDHGPNEEMDKSSGVDVSVQKKSPKLVLPPVHDKRGSSRKRPNPRKAHETALASANSTGEEPDVASGLPPLSRLREVSHERTTPRGEQRSGTSGGHPREARGPPWTDQSKKYNYERVAQRLDVSLSQLEGVVSRVERRLRRKGTQGGGSVKRLLRFENEGDLKPLQAPSRRRTLSLPPLCSATQPPLVSGTTRNALLHQVSLKHLLAATVEAVQRNSQQERTL